MMDSNRKAKVNAQIAARLYHRRRVWLDRRYRVLENGDGSSDVKLRETEALKDRPLDGEETVYNYVGDLVRARECVARVLDRTPGDRLRIENFGRGNGDSDEHYWRVSGGGISINEDELREAMAVWALERARLLDKEESEEEDDDGSE